MSNTDKIHGAALELLRQEYHSVSIILSKSDHPTLDDEIYYAEGATLGRAVQNLWQDLRECPLGGEREAYFNFSDWLVIDAKTFCNLDPSVLGRLESLLDQCCPDVKRSLRAKERADRAFAKGWKIGQAMFFWSIGAFLVTVPTVFWYSKFLLVIAVLSGLAATLAVICGFLVLESKEIRSDRALGEGND